MQTALTESQRANIKLIINNNKKQTNKKTGACKKVQLRKLSSKVTDTTIYMLRLYQSNDSLRLLLSVYHKVPFSMDSINKWISGQKSFLNHSFNLQ